MVFEELEMKFVVPCRVRFVLEDEDPALRVLEADLRLGRTFHGHREPPNDARGFGVHHHLVGHVYLSLFQWPTRALDLGHLLLGRLLAASDFAREGAAIDFLVLVADEDLVVAWQLGGPGRFHGAILGSGELDVGLGRALEGDGTGGWVELGSAGTGAEDGEGEAGSAFAFVESVSACYYTCHCLLLLLEVFLHEVFREEEGSTRLVAWLVRVWMEEFEGMEWKRKDEPTHQKNPVTSSSPRLLRAPHVYLRSGLPVSSKH